MEIHSDNVNRLNEWAAVLFREWTNTCEKESERERERKKRILDTPNWAWQEALTCGFERWSYLDENTNVYSVALFTMLKNRQTYKNVSKNEQMADASNVQVNK